MNVMITGNQGYIGSVLTDILVGKGYNVIGFDIGYYKDCTLEELNNKNKQITKDIRNIEKKDLHNIDAVIHLAALSNDPLGELDPKLTEEINYNGSVRVAEIAKKVGIKRFVMASTQSIYGIAEVNKELDEENSTKNPITAYAKTKWWAENDIRKLNSDDFTVVFFRPSTVFGVSPRLRCDIVYNNFVGCAYTTNSIKIKSDGTPWRPVVHVKDVCKAFIAGIEAPKKVVSNQVFNVGIRNGNYTVRELAEAAQKVVKGSSLMFTGEHTDSRTYKVNFRKILNELKEYYEPNWNLLLGGNELVDFFNKINFDNSLFNSKKCIRLKQLKYLLESGGVNEKLEVIR